MSNVPSIVTGSVSVAAALPVLLFGVGGVAFRLLICTISALLVAMIVLLAMQKGAPPPAAPPIAQRVTWSDSLEDSARPQMSLRSASKVREAEERRRKAMEKSALDELRDDRYTSKKVAR